MPSLPPTLFRTAYEGGAPWDIGRPQPAFVQLEEMGKIRGSVLDIGCGTGDNALYLAQRGHDVLGVDFIAEAIHRAAEKATAQGLSASFLSWDAFAIGQLGRKFDTAIDSGFFHVLGDEDRPRFVEGLGKVLVPGGLYHMLCFSELTPGQGGPRRVTQVEIRAAFPSPIWKVSGIEPATFITRLEGQQPHAWLSTVERLAP